MNPQAALIGFVTSLPIDILVLTIILMVMGSRKRR